VVLDAPVGSGKTWIAESIRMAWGEKSAYVCSGKDLQMQMARDFNAPILMGRSNYTPVPAPWDTDITCADCDYVPGERLLAECSLCNQVATCPYTMARSLAETSATAALNSHYLLNAVRNPTSSWSKRKLIVIDECDTLEDVMMAQAEISINGRRASRLGLTAPDKLTKTESYLEWIEKTTPCIEAYRRKLNRVDIKDRREARLLDDTLANLRLMRDDLNDGYPWVYTGGLGGRGRSRGGEHIAFKPVSVARYGAKTFWKPDQRYLMMSGTVVSSQVMLNELGWGALDGNVAHTSISIPSPFDARNRLVTSLPVADMSRGGIERDPTAYDRMAQWIVRLMNKHPGRTLVHTVSYDLADQLARRLRGDADHPALTTRPVFTYASSDMRALTLENYRDTPDAILLAASMDRGIDLPDDACRLQIVAKCPYPNLGDQQVSMRLHAPMGEQWYNVKVARSIQQMCGRGVRHPDDYAATYILDQQFIKHYRGWQHFYPKWWRFAYRQERI
jgi:Rad3-related DNA helicase